MALNPNASAAGGVYKAVTDAMSVFGPTNKAKGRPLLNSGEEMEEYSSSLKDEDILELTTAWKSRFSRYYERIRGTQKKAFEYWLGKQPGTQMLLTNATGGASDIVDNVIFPMVETLIPIVTRANPDPVISADPTPAGQALSKALYSALSSEADRQKLKRKMARLLREWCWNRIGVVKSGWDYPSKKIKTEIIPADRMIFDTDGHVDEGGRFCGLYLGERKKETASVLAEMFPAKKIIIAGLAGGQMATKLEYVEWWYCGTDVFFTIDEARVVLGKYKNPYWNYDRKPRRTAKPEEETAEIKARESAEESEENEEEEEEGEADLIKAYNFFSKPTDPYIFLSIFSAGKEPYDDTSLILQNIVNQDMVNRRARQIDKNVNGMNVGMVLSGDHFTDEQATTAANSLYRGDAILVPKGDVEKAAKRFPPEPIPEVVYRNLEDMRQEIMNIAGVGASSSQGVGEQKTVRGKIITQQSDLTRLSLITESIEQVADTIYNQWVQIITVFFDEEQYFISAGTKEGKELVTVKADAFPEIKTLNITVKEGSAIPKDPLTKRNEAIDLWQSGAIGALKFYERLGESDPQEMTKDLILWEMVKSGQLPPQSYLPAIADELPAPPAQPNQQKQPNQPPGGLPGVQQGPGAGAGPGSTEAVGQEMNALERSVPVPSIR
ncbi:MAG: hypothetical protein KGJ89_05195 [Patescibacteria group bacterium]|nr:hypothetical protein [Patescibacteria group bacterium]